MIRLPWLFLRGVLISVLLPAGFVGAVRAGEPMHDFLPDLQLPTLDGGTAATWDHRGSKLLLVEFASW